jgi:hypothetical protein
MKRSWVLFLLSFSASAEEPIVGLSNNLKYIDTPDCEVDPWEPCPEGFECLEDFEWYRTYRLEGFKDLRGKTYGAPKVLISSHTMRAGAGLFMIEKLPPKLQRECEATYKVINWAPIESVICLNEPIDESFAGRVNSELSFRRGEEWCYHTGYLQ